VAGGLLEPDAMDIDVHALHQGYLRGLRARGGSLVCGAEARLLAHDGADWQVETAAGGFAAPVVVDAAGAWADELGRMAGAAPIGLVPKRRTAITFDPPAGLPIDRWPAVIDIDEQWYFKPDAGRLLASPADETPSPPCDAQPEEMDIALAVDRIERAASFRIRRIEHKWAGLRSFVADKTPVVGFDDRVEGFFWLAGQGGYGIQTSPAMGRLAAALAAGEGVPADLATLGVDAAALSPRRLR
jgi:D-arginine dehydrogenase